MLRFLRHLVGGSAKPSDDLPTVREQASRNSRDIAGPNAAASPIDPDDTPNSFVRRDAVLDHSEKIAGYEFSLLTTLRDAS